MKKAILFISLIFAGCSVRSEASDITTKDANIFIENMDAKFTSQNSYFLDLEKVKSVKLGMTEDEVYQVIGTREFKTRHTFNKILAKRLMKGKYIPVTQIVAFSGYRTLVTESIGNTRYQPQKGLGVAFYFYMNRLIHITIKNREKKDRKWILLPDSSEEVRYVANQIGSEEPLGFASTNGGGDEKYYGFVNGYLGEKFTNSGERYFVPLVPLGKHLTLDFLSDYCKRSYYWEAPDYETELKKSGYYKLKAKLDKDFENKTGYWEEK